MASIIKIVVVALVLQAGATSCDMIFNMNWTFPNDIGNLIPLNKEGNLVTLTGSAIVDIYATRNTENLEFQVFFVNSTPDSFTLAIVAQNWESQTTPKARVIWSANPWRPVGGNARLIAARGNLELIDANEIHVWNPSPSLTPGYTSMVMTNLGNMVLMANTTIKWQSFDSLTSTLVGQTPLKPGKKLISTISETNLTPGPYSLEVENNRLVLYYSRPDAMNPPMKEAYWSLRSNTSSPVFAALCSSHGTAMTSNFLRLGTDFSSFNQTNTLADEECSGIQPTAELFLGKSSPNATMFMLALQPDGDLQVLAWMPEEYPKTESSWEATSSVFQDKPCQLPRRCGSFRTCNTATGECGGCLLGFVEVDPNNRELGCLQKTSKKIKPSERCDLDAFQDLPGYHYFASDFMETPTNTTAEECKRRCIENCSCQASFYREDKAGNKFCYVPEDAAVTIQNVSGQTHIAFLRISVDSRASPGGPGSNKKLGLVVRIVGGSVGALATLILLAVVILRFARKSLLHTRSASGEDMMLELPTSSLPKRFSSKELEEITRNYSSIIGSGGFGVVYKGVLSNGDEVAVKKLERANLNQQEKQFYAEVQLLANTKHRNLVQIVGFSGKTTLIYEYMVNGSLDTWLFNDEKRGALAWETRLSIALGTAKGLSYLHDGCVVKIIHLDVKPQNILLDSEFNAKIGDFGLSKPMERQQSCVITLTMKGTPGYLAPEWNNGVITEKTDVYSFGVVLLELVSGRRYQELLTDSNNTSTGAVGDRSDRDESVVELLIDKSLPSLDNQQVQRTMRAALLCMQSEPARRPSMSSVVQMLQGLQDVPALAISSTPPVLVSMTKAVLESGSSSPRTSTPVVSSSAS